MIGSASSVGGTPISVNVTHISSSIGSSTNSAAFRLDPRSLLPIVADLLMGKLPLQGVEDCEAGTEVAKNGRKGWIKSLNAMSKEGGFFKEGRTV